MRTDSNLVEDDDRPAKRILSADMIVYLAVTREIVTSILDLWGQ